MKILRVLISSPGDVAEERDRAKQVVEALRRRYAGRLDVRALLWEELPLQADVSFQQGIDTILSDDRGVDIAVFILWSRLGSPLGALIRKAQGGEYRSGTEREFDLMLQAREQSGRKRPQILVYIRQDEASFDERLRGQTTDAKNELVEQKRLVESFIAEEFHDSDRRANLRAYHSFDQPVTFSKRLRIHLQELLDETASDDVGTSVWDIDVKGAPFRALEAFQFEHAPVFFGREDEVLEVRQALRDQARQGRAFVLISGPSGSGKSSLARAGVVPAIMEYEQDDAVTAWRSIVFTPQQIGDDLITGFARLLVGDGALSELGDNTSIDDLAAGLRSDPALTFRLTIKLATARASRGKGSVRLIVLVDQMEELFTDSRITVEQRERFVAVLDAFARSGSVWILGTARSDFYESLLSVCLIAELKQGRGHIDLRPPGADALLRIIEEPARLAGLRFEMREDRSLADRILRDASDHPELLPLLEYVLRELFEERTREGVLAYATYEKLGGVVGALAKKAETVYLAQSSEAKAAFPSLMRALVTVSDNAGEEHVVRRRPAIRDVAEAPAVRALMEAFVSGRLLTTDGDGEYATVSVAHEALFRVWDRARGWVEQNRDFLRVRARVASRMEEGSALLEGDPLLDEACYQLRQNIQNFSASEREFIERCAGAVDRARTRRRNVRNAVLAGMFVLTVLATAAAFWATIKQREIWRAATRVVSLLAQADIDRAISLLETPDSALALPYLIRASESSVGDDFALKRLWHALAYRLWPVAISESDPFLSGVSQLRVLPNGKETLAVTNDGRIHVIDVWSGKASRASLNAGDDIRAIDLSPDGSLVAAGCKNGIVKIWSLASESSDPMAEYQHQNVVSAVAWFGASPVLLSASIDGVIRSMDLKSKQAASLAHLEQAAHTLTAHSRDSDVMLGLSGSQVLVWDNDKANPRIYEASSPVVDARLTQDGKSLIAAEETGDIVVWDAEHGITRSRLPFDQTVSKVAIDPEGRYVAVSGERYARCYKLEASLSEVASWQLTAPITSMRFVQPGVLAVLVQGGQIQIRSFHAGAIQHEPIREPSGIVAFDATSAVMVTISNDRIFRCWQFASACGAPIFDADLQSPIVATSPGSSGFEVLLARGERTRLDVDGRAARTAFQFGKVLAAAATDTGEFIAGSDSGIVFSADDHPRQLVKHPEPIDRCAFSRKHNLVAYALQSGKVHLINAVSGLPAEVEPEPHDGKVIALAFGDDCLISAGWDRKIHALRISDRAKTAARVESDPIESVMAHDQAALGLRLADGSIWVAAAGVEGIKQPAVYRPPTRPTCMALARSGRAVCLASEQRFWTLVDPSTGTEIARSPELGRRITKLTITPDEAEVIAGSESGEVAAFQLSSGRRISEWLPCPLNLQHLSFNEITGHLLCASGDGMAIGWDFGFHKTPEFRQKVISIARSLTPFEWQSETSTIVPRAPKMPQGKAVRIHHLGKGAEAGKSNPN